MSKQVIVQELEIQQSGWTGAEGNCIVAHYDGYLTDATLICETIDKRHDSFLRYADGMARVIKINLN